LHHRFQYIWIIYLETIFFFKFAIVLSKFSTIKFLNPKLHFHFRWEALHVYLGRLYLEIRPVRRVDAAFSQTHGPKTVQVPPLPAVVLALRPPVAAHEETLTLAAATTPHNDCSYLAKFTLCAQSKSHIPTPCPPKFWNEMPKNGC